MCQKIILLVRRTYLVFLKQYTNKHLNKLIRSKKILKMTNLSKKITKNDDVKKTK